MIEQSETNAVIPEAVQGRLRGYIEELLTSFELQPLTDDEWTSILREYPRRYWKVLAEVVSKVRGECSVAQPVLTGDSRCDIETLLKAVDLAPLTEKELLMVQFTFGKWYFEFVNDLIAQARGSRHYRDVATAIVTYREHVWSITQWDVNHFCEDNGESALSDTEMQQLFLILREDFDRDEVIAVALDCLRSGKLRDSRLETLSRAAMSAIR